MTVIIYTIDDDRHLLDGSHVIDAMLLNALVVPTRHAWFEAQLPSRHRVHDLLGRDNGMRKKRIVDHRRLITVAPDRMTRPRRRVGDDAHFETLLDQVAQVRLDTHIG